MSMFVLPKLQNPRPVITPQEIDIADPTSVVVLPDRYFRPERIESGANRSLKLHLPTPRGNLRPDIVYITIDGTKYELPCSVQEFPTMISLADILLLNDKRSNTSDDESDRNKRPHQEQEGTSRELSLSLSLFLSQSISLSQSLNLSLSLSLSLSLLSLRVYACFDVLSAFSHSIISLG